MPRITITVTPQIKKDLETLVKTGYFGRTVAEAASEFVTKGVRDNLTFTFAVPSDGDIGRAFREGEAAARGRNIKR